MRHTRVVLSSIQFDVVKGFTVHPEREAVDGRAIGSGQSDSSVHPERVAPLRPFDRLRAIGSGQSDSSVHPERVAPLRPFDPSTGSGQSAQG